jgi:hypothetical protein
MASRNIAVSVSRARNSAVLLALLLAACVSPPTLTFVATSSWRTRPERAVQAHAWSAGAQLGWSAGTLEPKAAQADAEIEPARTGRTEAEAIAAPCAWGSTCSWERDARGAALFRAGDGLEGERP